MREIKFRGKRIDNGEWVFGSLLAWERGSYAIIAECCWQSNGSNLFPECDSSHDRAVDPVTVGQYTGLKDKNGVEIFEGDKVRYKDYSNGAFLSLSGKGDIQPRFDVIVEIDDILSDKTWRGFGFIRPSKFGDGSDVEVIGNIYEEK